MPRAKSSSKTRNNTSQVLSRDVLFTAFSEQSERVEKELFNSYDLEDISGFYPSSLVLSMCLGKIVSGLYVCSGSEQGAKTTSLATVVGQSLFEGTMIHKHIDVERATRQGYIGSIISRYAEIPWDKLNPKDKNEHPRYRLIYETSVEEVFYEIQSYLESLPDKVYIPDRDEWFLVFDTTYKNKKYEDLHARIAKQGVKDSKLSDKNYVYYSVGKDSSFQVFYAIDSIKAMTLRSVEEHKKGHHQPGLLAKSLSDNLPYVKGLLRPKHAVMYCLNHMYVNPMEKFGDPLYETAGNALKLHSDVRCIQKPTSVVKPFPREKGNGKICAEASVIGSGDDTYTFKSIRNVKNKFAPVPYISGRMRIWSSGPGFLPGIDPVYDTASFLEMIGLASIGTSNGKPILQLTKNKILEGYSGERIDWMDFKAETLAECGLDTGAEPGSLREICFDLIDSGEAFTLYQSRNESGQNHLADDSADE